MMMNRVKTTYIKPILTILYYVVNLILIRVGAHLCPVADACKIRFVFFLISSFIARMSPDSTISVIVLVD